MTTAPDAPALPSGPLKLLPCPFCAGHAEFERVGTHRVCNIVACTNCGARLESGETWNQGSRWNERAGGSAALLKLADEIQESYRYSGGQVYANKLRALVLEASPEWALIQKLREGEGDSITLCCDKPDFGPGPEAIVTFNGHMTNWEDRPYHGATVLQALQLCAADLDKFEAAQHEMLNTVHCTFIDPSYTPPTHKGRAP